MINTRNIYVYLKGGDPEDLTGFLGESEDFHIEAIDNGFLKLETDSDNFIDILAAAREFSLVELYRDFTAFIAPKEFDFNLHDILKLLPDLSPDIYTFETLITEMVFMNRQELLKKMRNHFYARFNAETIETVLGFIEANMNASKTSKALYMHRNTLNYRLDNFIAKTEIDVRTFKGALAIYLLFRR